MKRIAEPVETTELCSYGCDQVARFKNGSGKLMCCERSNSCPAVKAKNSAGVLAADIDYENRYSRIPEETKRRMVWSKGLDKDSHPSIKRTSEKLTGRRKITNETKLAKMIYREACSFDLTGVIHLVKGYELLKEFGMYSRTSNPLGVVRDHIISVDYGFNNNINPTIISHPANCEFLPHKKNSSKGRQCGMDLNELLDLIDAW